MKRNSSRIAWLFVLPAIVVVAWSLAMQQTDPSAWPQYKAFRCQTCGEPASVNRDFVEQWGCRKCGYVTYAIQKRFRIARPGDFGGEEEPWLVAIEDAGFERRGRIYFSFSEESLGDATAAGAWNRAMISGQ